MSPLPGLTEKIAASLVMKLLGASAGIIRKRLSQSDARKALEAAVASALAEALEGQELRDRDQDWKHYTSLLEEFFTREEVAFELAQLLDPRPDQVPDFPTLAHEFHMAGYDPEDLPGFDLDGFLRAFFSAFYAAAGVQDSLRSGIELKALGAQLQRLGIVADASLRGADAAERIAESVGRIELVIERFVAGKSEEEELRRIVEAARAEGFLAAYRTFEDIGSGLLKAGVDLGVDARGVLELLPSGSEASRALPPARLEAVRLLAGELRSAVLDHSPSEDELNALEARYRQHIIRWFESLTFRGMMRAPKPIVLPLEEVYVELRAVAEVPEAADAFSVEERRLLLESDEKDETKRRELMSQLDAFRRERWSRTIPERKSMAEALHQRDRRAFVILGDPGSGKTTLLHFLALVYARGPETAAQRLGVDLAEADRLPIFVPLAAFDDMLRESQREGRSLTLREFLPRYYDRRRGLPGLEPLFCRAFDFGRALVLLDGLDEVLDVGTRTYVAQQANALIGDLAGVRFAVSSRFVGYREAPLTLPTLSVLDFGTPEIETFVRRWAHAFEKWAANGVESPEMLRRAQKLEADLLEDVKSNESVRRLAANPLMLTMLALLRRQVGRLPHRRVQLYESYVGTLLENWVDARSEGARERSVEILDQHQAESILIPLALWLQKEKPSGTAGRVEIQNKLVEICLADRGIKTEEAERSAVREAETQADRFLQEMRQMAGLIIERGHDAFGFLHLTFQEYFAGRALAQLKDEERWKTIRLNLHDPRWREPILLCAGRLGVVENRRAQVTGLVRSILEHEDPTEEDLHRNLLCALSIACDDVNLEPALVSELVERALAQLSTQISVYARELLRILGQLVVNGMAEFEMCLERVEAAGGGVWRFMAVKEWGRFIEVENIVMWLRRQLESSDRRIPGAALEALALRLGEEEALQQKAFFLLDDIFAGFSAARALARIVPSHPDIREELLRQLKQGGLRASYFALFSLSALVRSHPEMRDLFLEKLADSRGSVRRAALEGLASVIDDDIEVRRAVLDKLDDVEKIVRESAVRAVSDVLVRDQEALSRMMVVMDRSEDLMLFLGGLKVGALGIPDIRKFFEERLRAVSWRSRRAACQGLAESGTASIEDLRTVLRYRETLESIELLRGCAIFSEFKQGKRWVEFWQNLLSNQEPDIQDAAMIALSIREDIDYWQRFGVGGDHNFSMRLHAMKKIVEGESGGFEDLWPTLWNWLGADGGYRESESLDRGEVQYLQAQIAKHFGSRLPMNSSLRDDLLTRLREPRWSERLGAALALLAWPGGPPDEIMVQVLDALVDRRGLEAYPAQLTAASYLLCRNETAREVIELCLEALDYGTQPWENLYESGAVRRQATLVLGKLEPVSYDDRIYDTLLRVLHNDEDSSVRDAAYGTLVRLARMRDQQACCRLT